MNFTATGRSRSRCVPTQTAPIPPCLSKRSRRYLPATTSPAEGSRSIFGATGGTVGRSETSPDAPSPAGGGVDQSFSPIALVSGGGAAGGGLDGDVLRAPWNEGREARLDRGGEAVCQF